MSEFDEKIDKVAGKAKEATGNVTGDEQLEDKGHAQQAEAEAKESVKKAGKHLGAAAEKIRGAFKK